MYNEALAYKRNNSISRNGLINRLPGLKREYEWLKEAPSAALQQSIIDLGRAFANKKNGHCGVPVFHRKGNDESFRIPVPCKVDYPRYRVNIPKLGSVKLYRDKPIDQSKIHSFAVSRTMTDRYYISILYGVPDRVPLDNGQAVGIDVREWNCPECGKHHDRDGNAAKNILREGLSRYSPIAPLGAIE